MKVFLRWFAVLLAAILVGLAFLGVDSRASVPPGDSAEQTETAAVEVFRAPRTVFQADELPSFDLLPGISLILPSEESDEPPASEINLATTTATTTVPDFPPAVSTTTVSTTTDAIEADEELLSPPATTTATTTVPDLPPAAGTTTAGTTTDAIEADESPAPEPLESNVLLWLQAKLAEWVPRTLAANRAITDIKLLTMNGRETPVKVVTQQTESGQRLSFVPEGSFRPGRYTLQLELSEAGQRQVVEHEFVWGVLAINTNQSIYLPGAKAYLQLAALNEYGHTICDANLKLEIIDPQGIMTEFRTADNGLTASETCGVNNVTDEPDYFTYYQTTVSGRYELKLTNEDNGYLINDSFEVRAAVPFEVERIAATRINPFRADYTMKIKVTARQDFAGEITETVPNSFEVTSVKFRTENESAKEKRLVAAVNLPAGATEEFSYTYRAPAVSPQLYLVGPLRFSAESAERQGPAVFEEARAWQIAADAACESLATGNWDAAGTWTNCGGTIPQAGDTVLINAHTVTLNVSSNEIASLNIGSGGTLTTDNNSRVLNLKGTSGTLFTRVGTFTAGNSKVQIESDGAVTLTSGTFTGSNAFWELEITPTITADRTYTFGSGAIAVDSLFSVLASGSGLTLTVNLGASITVASTNITQIGNGTATANLNTVSGSNYALSTGGLSIISGGTLTANGSTITLTRTSGIAFNRSVGGGGTFTAGSSTVVINGNGSVTLTSGTFTGSNAFWNLTLSPTITLARTYTFGSGAIEINGNFNINPSAASALALTVNMGAAITVAAGKTTTITRTSSATANLDTVSGSNYSLSTGLLNIATGGTLTANNSTITLTGTSGTIFTRTGTFTAGSSTVVVNGDGAVTLTSGTFTGSNAFYDLTLSPTITLDRTYTFGSGAITVNGNFTINPSAAFARALTVNLGAGGVFTSVSTIITRSSSATSNLNTTTNNYTLDTGFINIATGGTLTANGSTITLFGLASTVFTRNGTFTAGSSTVVITGNENNTLTSGTFTGGNAFWNLTLSPTLTAGLTYTFGSGAIEINGDFTINPSAASALALTVNLGAAITVAAGKTTTITGTGAGPATSVLDTRPAATDYNLTTGSLDIAANGTLDAGSSASVITVSGDITRAGTLTAGSSTFTLNGSGKQTVNSAMVGATGAFYNLTITNNSGTAPSDCEITGWVPSVDFAAAASTTNNFTITTASVKVEYNSGSLYTFQNVNWNGQAAGTRIYFRNSAASGSWRLDVPGTQTAVSYVNVSRSDASAGLSINASDGTSTDCGNNVNWGFPYLTFSVSTNGFPAITPGTSAIFATSTLSADTNISTGWYVTLYGTDTGTPTGNTTMDHDDYPAVGLTDQTQWLPGAATTTAGNAVRISALDNSGDVLAFRVMTASGSVPFRAATWWGSADNYADSVSTLWAGIASSSAANLRIGNTNVSSGGVPVLNTVLYYLKLPATQQSGNYSGELIFTATANP